MDTETGRAFDLAKDRLAQFKQLTAELETLTVKERELNASRIKENADVEKVETKNITTVFYSVVGSLDEHVEKERSEAFAARQKYDRVLKDMEDVKKWHHGVPTDEQYELAMKELDQQFAALIEG